MSVRSILGSVSTTGLSVLILAGALAASAAAQLPPNFSMQRVLVGGLDQPISVAFIPRSNTGTPIVRMLVGERTGRLLYKEVGSTAPAVVLLTLTDIGAELPGELGFLGLCVDPRWGVPSPFPTDFVYILYTERDPTDFCTGQCYRYRIERLHINFSAIIPFIDQRTLIYAGPGYDALTQCCHWSGDLHFVGLDTMLYSTGDHWTAQMIPLVQDPNSEVGKIMQLQRTPSGTAPFSDPSMLFSGLRNPFRFNTDGSGAGGTVYIGNVGSNGECGFVYEELNAALATAQGTNFGWPCTEGPPPSCDCNDPFFQSIPICAATSCLNFTAPLWAYDHNVGSSITQGPVYRGDVYPDNYFGDVFVADFVQNWIKRVSLDGSTPQVIDFLQPSSLLTGGIVDMEVGPDGYLYAVQIFNGGPTNPPGVYRFFHP